MTARGRGVALAAAVVLALAACTGSAPPQTSPQPVSSAPSASTTAGAGARSATALGDRLFPTLGDAGYDVQAYHLRLRYPARDVSQPVEGAVGIDAVARSALARVDLDFAGDGTPVATVDGRPATATRSAEKLFVKPARAIPAGRRFRVDIRGFTARPRPFAASDTLQPFVAGRHATFLNAQPDGMHEVFPCNDHPRDKATYRITVDAPQGWTAVASGTPSGQRSAGDRQVWSFEHRQPMATELLQVAVGDLDVVTRTGPRGLLVRDAVPRGPAGAVIARQLAVELDQLRWLEARLGPYPFDVYGSLVPDQAQGSALETQTLSWYTTDLFGPRVPLGLRNGTMLHELAHQWFGNSVSPRDWSDVWLSEGHATWYELQYTAEHGWLAQDWRYHGLSDTGSVTSILHELYRRSDRDRARDGPVAAPARSRTPRDLFNRTVYFGGVLTLAALQHEIGTEAFDRLERTWLTRYQGASASTDDFIRLAGEVAGRDLTGFLRPWLYDIRTPPMPGHPDWRTDPA